MRCMARKFDDLWQKARKGDESNKPLLNQVNYVLLHLHLAGKHDAKPTHDELKDWLHSGQVDVLRMNKQPAIQLITPLLLIPIFSSNRSQQAWLFRVSCDHYCPFRDLMDIILNPVDCQDIAALPSSSSIVSLAISITV